MPEPGKDDQQDDGDELSDKAPTHDLIRVAPVEITTFGEGADTEDEDRGDDKRSKGREEEKGISQHGVLFLCARRHNSATGESLKRKGGMRRVKLLSQPFAISQSSMGRGSSQRAKAISQVALVT